MPVPDVSAIVAIVGSLNTAKEIAKSLVGLRDTSMIQGKVIELQSAILSAQERICGQYCSNGVAGGSTRT